MSIIQIVLPILILASLVIAFFSARTWHWGHVLVVLGIFLSSVCFFILASETVRINAVYRKKVNDLNKQLTDVEARNRAIEFGTSDPSLVNQLRGQEVRIPEDAESVPSLSDLNHELFLATRIRGPEWRKIMPAGFDPKTGAVKITVEAPTPAGINPDTVVFLFEEGPPALPDPTRGAQYLGEFRVSEAAGQAATLQPMLELDEFAARRIAGSHGPWVMYESMPVDRHEIFAGKTEEQLKQMVPPQSLKEYIHHGQPAVADDDQWHRAGYDENGTRLKPADIDKATKILYQRRLRNYALEFEELARRRALLLTDIAAVTKDNERLLAALEGGKKIQAFREEEIRKLKIDLAGVTKEREAIEAHLKLVQRQLARAEQLLADALRQNSQLVKELAARQSQGIIIIDGATSTSTPAKVGSLALDGSR